ncbi:MAG: hypothetical protein AAGK14_13690 [Verrucomicrobiota bacterium]
MESYPVNVLLAVLAAFISVLLGFLPIKQLPATFFRNHMGVVAILWLAVGLMMPGTLFFTVGIAGLSSIAWYLWRRELTLQAKVWQSSAAALGVSLGIISVLQNSPQSVPDGMPAAAQSWFLAGPFLVGAVLGTGYLLTAVAWQYSAVETDPQLVRAESGLLQTLLIWNLITLGLQAVFAVCALLMLPSLYPDFGEPLVDRLTSFEPPGGQGTLFAARIALGFALPFGLVAWLWTHARSTPVARWFWWPLVAMVSTVVGQLLVLQLHI